jgi:stage III sporulation protein AD
MSIYELLAMALLSAITIALVRQYKPELALPLAVASGALLLVASLKSFLPVFTSLKELAESSGIKAEYFKIMLKALGICYITQFASEVCVDFGQTSLGSKIELCGKLALAAISLPLVISLIKTVTEIVG